MLSLSDVLDAPDCCSKSIGLLLLCEQIGKAKNKQPGGNGGCMFCLVRGSPKPDPKKNHTGKKDCALHSSWGGVFFELQKAELLPAVPVPRRIKQVDVKEWQLTPVLRIYAFRTFFGVVFRYNPLACMSTRVTINITLVSGFPFCVHSARQCSSFGTSQKNLSKACTKMTTINRAKSLPL